MTNYQAMLALAAELGYLNGAASLYQTSGEVRDGYRSEPAISVRHGGVDRHDTAARSSAFAFADASEVDTVIVAKSGDFPDALAASTLAGTLGAPILLNPSTRTPEDWLNDLTKTELERLKPATIYILGDEDSLSLETEDALKKLSFAPTVKRLFGKGTTYRFGTAREVAEEAADNGADTSTLLLAKGGNFPDALAVSSFAASQRIPLLLTDDTPATDLHSEVVAYIKDHHPSTVYVLGDTASLTSEIEDELTKLGVTTVERLGGADRTATAHEVFKVFADRYKINPRFIAIASNGIVEGGRVNDYKFPDALVAGASVGFRGGILLPVALETLNDGAREYLTKFAPYKPSVEIFGDEKSINAAVEAEIDSILHPSAQSAA
jgi:putative cell wall-binding protein